MHAEESKFALNAQAKAVFEGRNGRNDDNFDHPQYVALKSKFSATLSSTGELRQPAIIEATKRNREMGREARFISVSIVALSVLPKVCPNAIEGEAISH